MALSVFASLYPQLSPGIQRCHDLNSLCCTVSGVVIESTQILDFELCVQCWNRWVIMHHRFKHTYSWLISPRSCWISSFFVFNVSQPCLQPLTCNHLKFPLKLFCIQYQCLRLTMCPRAQQELLKHFQVLTCIWTELPVCQHFTLSIRLLFLSTMALHTSGLTSEYYFSTTVLCCAVQSTPLPGEDL